MIFTSGLGDSSKPGTCHTCIVGVWRAVGLSEGTSLGHMETRLCIISQIWYGGSWGRMRNTHKIWGRSKVVCGVIGSFKKNAKAVRLPLIFQLKWASMWLSNWAEIWCVNVSRLEKHAQKISRDLHEWFGRCFKTRGVSCAYCGRLARCVTIRGDLFGTQGDWLVRF